MWLITHPHIWGPTKEKALPIWGHDGAVSVGKLPHYLVTQ